MPSLRANSNWAANPMTFQTFKAALTGFVFGALGMYAALWLTIRFVL